MRTRSTFRAIFASILAVALSCTSCSNNNNSSPSALSAAPMLIEPNVAVGKIQAGMRTNDVIKVFGEPQRCTANALEYTSLGFAVMPSPDGVVQIVMCGDVTGLDGPLVKAFNGRTKEGIGLGSSRDDLVKSFGQPTLAEKLVGTAESMRYDPLGITFTLQSGKVYHMIVRLPTDRQQQQQASGMTVDLSPSNAAK
jgi:hypothetical protein